jgi:hypothetical protein
MNYKKGLTRIFILGLVISPIAGFFSSAEDSNKIASGGWDTIYRFKEQSKLEPCASIVKTNPKVFPKSPGINCYIIEIYWDNVRKWQDENGKAGQIIDDETVTKAISADTSRLQWEVRWFQIAIYTIGYLLFWLVGLTIFYLGRWIIKGFKSQ